MSIAPTIAKTKTSRCRLRPLIFRDQPDPHVQGDVTGDGTVDVSDVNLIINVMLGKEINEHADVTGEGSVDVADVNQVINIMLGKN